MDLVYQASKSQVEDKVRNRKRAIISIEGNTKDGYVIVDMIPDPLSMGNTHRILHAREEEFGKMGIKIELVG